MRTPWLLLPTLLLLPLSHQALAQATPDLSGVLFTTSTTSTIPTTPYTIERDSLWRRAGRVRARTEARIAQFRMSSVALGGTRQKVVSYAQLKRQSAGGSLRYTRVKSEINKHKTNGLEVEKRSYYGLDERLLLTEYYEQHQLMRLELHEYPLREGGEYGTVFRDTRWLRGDYLRLTTHAQDNRGKITQHFYTEDHVSH
jgi:hypothetical protein